MYYKDDFYKEFRTEKELCEYLEEIDRQRRLYKQCRIKHPPKWK